MSYYPFAFDAPIARKSLGTLRYTVVFAPPEIVAGLPVEKARHIRIEADVAGFPLRGALQPARGRWFLMLPKALFKATGVAIGDVVSVHFRLDDPEQVELPEELATLLGASAKFRKGWDALSVGKQRALAYRVASAKRAPTRAARVEEIRDLLSGKMPPALAYLMRGASR